MKNAVGENCIVIKDDGARVQITPKCPYCNYIMDKQVINTYASLNCRNLVKVHYCTNCRKAFEIAVSR